MGAPAPGPVAEGDASPPPVRECARILLERGGLRPRLHLVLGSGLGGLSARVQDPVEVPFGDLPGFPATSVEGHSGRFLIGRIGDTAVLVQSGRFHFYEGVGADVVAAPVRVGRALGARTLVLTNAAGGIRTDLVPGSVMLVDDHLNLMFRSVLAGPVTGDEARFPDMSRPFDPALMALAEAAARDAGMLLTRGTYAAVGGPHFESPAEIRALRAAGADAVGMSTVPEVTVARAAAQRVLAFSLITNRASGLGLESLDHEEVMRYGEEAGSTLGTLLEALIPALHRASPGGGARVAEVSC